MKEHPTDPVVEYWRKQRRCLLPDNPAEDTVVAALYDFDSLEPTKLAELTYKQMQTLERWNLNEKRRLRRRGPIKAVWNLFNAMMERFANSLHDLAQSVRGGPYLPPVDRVLMESLAWTLVKSDDPGALKPFNNPARTAVYFVLCTGDENDLVKFSYPHPWRIHLGHEAAPESYWVTLMHVAVDETTGKISNALGIGGERWKHVWAYCDHPIAGYPGFTQEHEHGAQ